MEFMQIDSLAYSHKTPTLVAIEQKIDISARQIPPADAAGKEHIAADEQIVFARKEAKAAWTVTGHFEHLKLRAKKISSRRFFDKKIRLRRFYL